MNLSIIVEKRKFYSDKLKNLDIIDIESEVEKRLQDEKDRVRAIVKAEIDTDKSKCENYITLLDELIAEETDKAINEPIIDEILPDTQTLLESETTVSEPIYDFPNNVNV